MPRDVNGNFTLVAGNPVIAGTAITAAWANPTLSDVANSLTDSLDRNGNGGMLAPFTFADGVETLPAISFNSDPLTGRYLADVNDQRDVVTGQDVVRYQVGQVTITGNLTLTESVNATVEVVSEDIKATTFTEDGVELVDKYAAIADGFPAGGIIMWSGAIIAIPMGWVLCDGLNSTPDLRDKFIVGAGLDYEVDDEGGSESHGHTASTADHALTEAELALHGHPFRFCDQDTGTSDQGLRPDGGMQLHNAFNPTNVPAYDGVPDDTGGHQIGGTGDGEGHQHDATVDSTDTLPPYYALAYIMRTGV